MADGKSRCDWGGEDALMIEYHDTEWGVPQHDDTNLFEYLILDGAQAGLSWRTILHRREGYRRAFHGFDLQRVAALGGDDVERLLQDEGIIRNRAKVNSTIKNAKGTLEIQKEFGSFDTYLWGFVGGKTIVNRFKGLSDMPAETDESKEMSRDLKRRGFSFVGPTICYAVMQSAGMVNDHVVTCFRYDEV